MVLSVRNCGSDRKPWLVEREGFQFPIAAFHDEADAVRYMEKTRRLFERGRNK